MVKRMDCHISVYDKALWTEESLSVRFREDGRIKKALKLIAEKAGISLSQCIREGGLAHPIMGHNSPPSPNRQLFMWDYKEDDSNGRYGSYIEYQYDDGSVEGYYEYSAGYEFGYERGISPKRVYKKLGGRRSRRKRRIPED